jgi:hypothetical protein
VRRGNFIPLDELLDAGWNVAHLASQRLRNSATTE